MILMPNIHEIAASGECGRMRYAENLKKERIVSMYVLMFDVAQNCNLVIHENS
jgi:hypothetical protein